MSVYRVDKVGTSQNCVHVENKWNGQKTDTSDGLDTLEPQQLLDNVGSWDSLLKPYFNVMHFL